MFKSEDILDEVHDLVETPLEGLRELFMLEESPNIRCDFVLPKPLDHSYTSPLYSLPSVPHEYYIDAPTSNPMI